MRIVHQIIALYRALFRNRRVDDDLAEEMRFHIERQTEANIARGMPPEAARRAARLAFGSVDAAQERARDDRPGATIRQLARDLRFGARLLRKSPVFAITAVAIIALGIGAATAIFSVVYGVMLRPLPFREPERLVSIWLQRQRARNFPAAADAFDLRQLRGVFEDVALFENANLNLVGDGEPQRLQGARVSPNLFSVLGVSAALGRTFAPDEDQTGRERVVLLSDALWRGRFGADRGVVGRPLRLNGSPHTVVGVMPPEFTYPSGTHQAWVPLVLDPRELTREWTENYRVVARLAPGVTLDRARREASALAARLASASGGDGPGMTVDSMLDDAVRDVRPALILVLGAVSFLLAIACANLANLFGARASTRRGEFAVRLALGASRKRLIWQTIAEAAPVLVLGGLLGVTLAEWAVRVFVATATAGLPRTESIALSAPVILVSLALLALTGLAASIAPAMQAVASDFTTITKDGGRSATAGRGRATARSVGVAAQIAFALPLLVGASLLIRSAVNVARVELGFRPDRVATLAFEVSRSKHRSDQEVADYYARLIEAVRAIPGVATAGLVNRIPLAGGQTNPLHFETASGRADELTNVETRTVTPEYFAALGIRLLAGRGFTEHDDANAPPVAIVDERVARTVWPGEALIGKRFRGPAWRRDDRGVTVVGVVAHVRTTRVEADPLPQVYWSYRQWTQDRMVLAVRGEARSEPPIAAVITAIHSVDPEQSVYDVRPMTEIVGRSLAQRRVTTTLVAAFGGLALLLAAVGVYGVVAYGVAQRMREFGIRVALGATPRAVTRLVMWQGASTAIAGSVVGLLLAIAAAGVMRNLVYGVAPRDVASIAGATALLLLVAGVASYVPARRAAAVDPAVTLRAE